MRHFTSGNRLYALWFCAIMLLGLWAAPAVLAEEKPVYGGVMKVAIQGDPPSLDMHQEGTFLVMIPFGNVYNTLIKFHPHHHDEIVGDLAESWSRTEDGLTYTFKLRQGVKFHDGTDFTSADAKARWDKIVFPSKSVVSNRKSLYQMVKSIAAPDPDTVVFHLHYPAASFIPLMALPYNFIYQIMAEDHVRKNVGECHPYREFEGMQPSR
jgi:peptide/nickel transport system substrate-binding protein